MSASKAATALAERLKNEWHVGTLNAIAFVHAPPEVIAQAIDSAPEVKALRFALEMVLRYSVDLHGHHSIYDGDYRRLEPVLRAWTPPEPE